MVESGDSVKHISNIRVETPPMTVFEIENAMAYCGGYDNNHKLVAEWYNLDELIVITKGNTNG